MILNPRYATQKRERALETAKAAFCDEVSGLRYYNPSTGRWLSRDPSEEKGGANLNEFSGNRPTNSFDPHGDRIASFTGNVNDIGLGSPTIVPTDPDEAGEAGITWDFHVVNNNSTITATGMLALNPVIYPLAFKNENLLYKDRLGLNVVEHEHRHDAIAQKWWNLMVPLANGLEGHYKCPNCADLAETILNALNAYAKNGMIAENAKQDLDAYATGTKRGPALLSQMNAANGISDQALISERSAFRAFAGQGCVPE